MKFNEYLILRHGQYPISGLSDDLQEIIFNSPDARAVFQGLKAKSDEVDRFFAELPPDSEDDFFAVGNFPFSANLTNRVKALELIKNVLNSIIIKDIIGFARFKAQTVAKLNRLLYLIASSDIISYDSLRTTLKIERFETLDSLVEVLIMSGVLFKVPSLGKPFTSTRKTPKLLFTAPALRTAILDNIFRSNIEGKKLEDYFALIYNKDLKGRYKATIAYDIAEGGADFVLRLPNQKPVVIEIGFHKEDTTQVETTQKKVKGKYGIVFGSKKLQLTDESIVKVPLEYLLLI
ncbi:ATP-binding protein [candidate division WOR-3 bacterium]|nr:ATP-binding protein [candidate division WOR-3 bacterium]